MSSVGLRQSQAQSAARASQAADANAPAACLRKHVPELALALAGIALVLLALGPIGWRLGWWHFRFSLLTLMPWAAYVGLAAVIVSALALVIGLSRLVVRVAPANSGSRIDLRSSSRYGRSDFGVNAERIRDYLTALRAATTSKG